MTPLTISDVVMCPHGGKATFVPANPMLQVSNIPALTETDVKAGIIAGCTAFTMGLPICVSIASTACGSECATSGNMKIALCEKIATTITNNGSPLMLAGAPVAAGVADLKM